MRIVDKDKDIITFDELRELLDPDLNRGVIVRLSRSGRDRICFLKQRIGLTTWEWTPLDFGPNTAVFTAPDKDGLITCLQEELQFGHELHYFEDEKEFAAWPCENLREVFECGV